MRETAVVLFVLGGLLEILGISIVVLELWSDRKQERKVARIPVPTVGPDPLESWPESPKGSVYEAMDRDRRLQPAQAQAATTRGLQRAVADVYAKNRWLRVVGVLLLIGGVIAATAGNVLALCV